jgi:hypothetical protein
MRRALIALWDLSPSYLEETIEKISEALTAVVTVPKPENQVRSVRRDE